MNEILTWWVFYGSLRGLRMMSMEGSKADRREAWNSLWSLHAALGAPCIGRLPL